jgi:pheromone shutdown protein TraB
MKINFTAILFNFIKLAIIAAIIMGIIKGIKIFKSFIDSNTQIDKKSDDSLKELEKDKNKNKITNINAIFGLLFPFSLMGAIVSPMMFDAPGSNESFSTWVFFLSIFSFPIVILIAIITSLIFLFILKSYKKSLMFSLLPMVNIITIIFTILVGLICSQLKFGI